MLRAKIISNLDKVLGDGCYEDYREISSITALRGERVAFQLLCEAIPEGESNYPRLYRPTLSGDLAKHATVREVRHVPAMGNFRGNSDPDYITTKPGLIPDILAPLPYGGRMALPPRGLFTLWIELDIPRDSDICGKIPLTLSVTYDPINPSDIDLTLNFEIEIDVIDATLPECELIFTQWFHADCLADYYEVEKWSEEHFRIVESFVKTAVRNGVNMLYTPLLTPPLDNAFDTRDIQLTEIRVTGDSYEFGWDRLDRWIDIADRSGIKYFEIGHLFTQGGAKYATKAMGEVDGSHQRLFGKTTPSTDEGYTKFLRALLSSFLDHMKARGDDRRCFFHISDEPSEAQLEDYKAAKETVADLLSDYPVMDALSNYDFYAKGIVKTPVVLMNHLDSFIESEVPNLWTYNCCAPASEYSNRFLSMTLTRNRSIALMLYRYSFQGFLHWGYNFYNNAGSSDVIDPFLDTAAGGMFPSGDAFSVYPGRGGEPLESMRLVTFNEALQDLSAMKLCEKLYSRDEVIAAIESALGEPIKPTTYVNSSAPYIRIRELINDMIRKRV